MVNPDHSGADDGRAAAADEGTADGRHASIARALLAAFNDRDPASWVSVFHPDVVFRPSLLIGERARFDGHDGVLRYLDMLRARNAEQQARLRSVRSLGADDFVVFTEVVVGGTVVSPGAVIVRAAGGRIIEATAYLSDEQTLEMIGVIPPA